MQQFKRINNITGWLMFLIALTVYTLTLEETASFWDCGEFLSASVQLMVVHPPGAPMFLLLGKVFSLLALGDTAQMAFWVNMLSATATALCVLFTFWSITHFAKKIVVKAGEEITVAQSFLIMGAGIVGGLSMTFLDTLWFSAVEAEVYALSSMFTALAFWCILKWENVAETNGADRWLILICYIIGLSIGVHLLNLLVIPAIVFVYFFKRHSPTSKSFIYALLSAMGGIVLVQFVIIPGFPWFAAVSDRFLVNSLHMPFNSGFVTLLALIVGVIWWGYRFTLKRNKPLLNTLVIGVAFIAVGYSSYTMLPIRSMANVPLDHQNVEDPNALLSYLNREQYGEAPLLKGQWFGARPIGLKEGRMQYRRGKDEYEETSKKFSYKWAPGDEMTLPRMWSSRADHVQEYKNWESLEDGQKPKFKTNMHFMFTYQIGFMYWRYFLWNFVGRQNDQQGHNEMTKGNVKSGINAIDQMWLGPQDNMPANMANNKANNNYYFIPLLLGLLGLFYHVQKAQRDAFAVLMLFLFTGLFIVLYLNSPSIEPRERDYAYVGSFQVFCIWIGLSVLALADWLWKRMNRTSATGAALVICLTGPVLQGSQGWDDHDRSKRTTCLDFAIDYLESCDKNALLITNGDNDTYPLWYAQNVEGIRTDVRVVNYSLLATDWYANVLRRATYASQPFKLTLNEEQIAATKREYLSVSPQLGLPQLGATDSDFVDLRKVIDFIAREDGTNMSTFGQGKAEHYLPASRLSLPVDKDLCLKNGTIRPEDVSRMVDVLKWDIGAQSLYKNALVLLDVIANNAWKRPICFTITTGEEPYLNLEPYFQLEGLVYKLVPINTPVDPNNRSNVGNIDTDKMYNILMKKWKFGGMEKDGIYLDETTLRQTQNLKNVACRLATALVSENKQAKAIEVLDKFTAMMPEKNVPLGIGNMQIAQCYMIAGADGKGKAILNRLMRQSKENINYFNTFKGKQARNLQQEIGYENYVIENCNRILAINTGRPNMPTNATP
ncbi:MAG: DUF2723 domain-containing protein [Flavobacteriaceae bacterium]|nr:DUF2723 domain-containing protein [Flavobacteriaceae bacterium]